MPEDVERGARLIPRQKRYTDLANTAGTLGMTLDEYLLSRFTHLLLIYDSTALLQRRLEQLARHYTENSFFYFCRFFRLMEAFRVDGERVCPVEDSIASGAIQQFVNAIASSIPSEDEGTVDVYSIIQAVSDSKEDSTILDFTGSVQDGQRLVKEHEAYARWLLLAPPSLAVMTELLCGFSRNLTRAIAEDRGPASSSAPAGLRTRQARRLSESWAAGLSAAAVEAVRSEYSLPRALGTLDPSRPIHAPRPKRNRADSTEDKPQTPTTHGVGQVIIISPKGDVRFTSDTNMDIQGEKLVVAGRDVYTGTRPDSAAAEKPGDVQPTGK